MSNIGIEVAKKLPSVEYTFPLVASIGCNFMVALSFFDSQNSLLIIPIENAFTKMASPNMQIAT